MILNRGFPIAAQPQPNRTTKAVITADDADMADKTIRKICVIRGCDHEANYHNSESLFGRI